MATLSRPEDRERVMRWLNHGVGLARTRLKEKATFRNAIWLLISEALDMLDRTPDQEKRWLSSGTRSGGWNAVGLTKMDLIEIERLRVIAGIKPFDGETRYLPQRDDLERALGVLDWLRFCSRGDDHTLQKAVVLLAKGADDAAHRFYRNTGDRVRQTTYEIRTKSIGMIQRGLRETYGIVPSTDGRRFVEVNDAA